MESKVSVPGLDKLDAVADLVAKKPVAVDSAHCVKARLRQFSCDRCISACQSKAIRFTEEAGAPLAVDFARCNSCGACVTACPTGAFTFDAGLNDYDLLKKIALTCQDFVSDKLFFTCHKVDEQLREKAIDVPCFARLHEGLFLGAAKLGAREVLLISDCSSCSLNQSSFIQKQLEATANFLRRLGFKTNLRLINHEVDLSTWRSVLINKEQPTRRELLSGAAGFVKARTASWAEKVLAPLVPRVKEVERKGLKYFIPYKRQMVLDLAKDLQCRGKADFAPLGYSNITFNADTCNLCEDCVLFCPTTALALEERPEGRHLVFYAAHCVDCGLCGHVCQKESILLTETLNLKDFCRGNGRSLKLASVKYACAYCDWKFFASEPQALCPKCYELELATGVSEEELLQLEPVVVDNEESGS